MPRGVYDRGESKIKRLMAENERLKSELTDTRHALDKAKLAAKGETAVSIDASIADQFKILRDNLRELSESRKTLVNSDQMKDEVLAALDAEISAQLTCMTGLRSAVFPMKAPKAAPTVAAVQGQVPFPAVMPSGFQSATVR